MTRTAGALAIGTLGVAASACFSPISIGGGPLYTGAPPATSVASSGEAIHWELLEGHLAWARDATILVADAAHRKLARLSYSGASGIWGGSVALSPDATHVALAGILHATWPYRLFVSSVTGGATMALLPLGTDEPQKWPAWTPDGLEVVFPDANASKGGGPSVQAIRGDGSGLRTLPLSSSLGPVAISPDGKTAATALDDGIYIVAVDGSGMRQIAASPPGRTLYGPSWSHDGAHLAFVSRHGLNEPANGEPQQFQIFTSDLQAPATALVTVTSSKVLCDAYVSWGPGTRLAFNKCVLDADGGAHIYVADTTTGEASPLTSGKVFENAPSWVE